MNNLNIVIQKDLAKEKLLADKNIQLATIKSAITKLLSRKDLLPGEAFARLNKLEAEKARILASLQRSNNNLSKYL